MQAVLEQPVIVNSNAQHFYGRGVLPTAVVADAEVVYPESDGQPMGETGFHVRAIMHLYNALRQFFADRTDVYVAADMFLYYEEGKPSVKKAPDVMVIKGVGNQERRVFETWTEQARPCVVFEITSESSMFEDLMSKSRTYVTLGVREYFLFDPLREYLKNRLLGFRLQEDEYEAIVPDAEGRLFSEELGVWLSPANEILRVIDPQTGQVVPSLEEAMFQAAQEAQRAEQEAQRAERLAAQLRALGVEPEA